MRELDSNIVSVLASKLGKNQSTVKKDIYTLKSTKYGNLPVNAVAQLYAIANKTSVYKKLTMEEKETLPSIEVEKPVKIKQKKSTIRIKRIIEFIKYDTQDSFISGHVVETNKTYTHGCYTAAFILCRKILENLLTDIITKKFPKEKMTTEMYFDTTKGRKRDFSEIISNLRKRSKEFGAERSLLERILNRAEQFKDDANNKVHSWYHIVKSKKEIDETNVQDIIDLIVLLEKKL